VVHAAYVPDRVAHARGDAEPSTVETALVGTGHVVLAGQDLHRPVIELRVQKRCMCANAGSIGACSGRAGVRSTVLIRLSGTRLADEGVIVAQP